MPRTSVLVVADDGVTELLTRLLDREGYSTASARADPSALARVAEGDVGCVVLDLETGPPGRSLSLLEALRLHGDPAVASVRVVLLGGDSSASEAEVDAFLVRPFHANDFLRVVAEVT